MKNEIRLIRIILEVSSVASAERVVKEDALFAVEGEGEGNLGGLLGRSHRHFHIVK